MRANTAKGIEPHDDIEAWRARKWVGQNAACGTIISEHQHGKGPKRTACTVVMLSATKHDAT